MRIRRITGQHAGSVEAINVTPLIDVVMCLIVFFLIVGKLASERGVAVPLPKAASGREETNTNLLVITIARSGEAPAAGRIPPGAPFNALGVMVQVDGKVVADTKALEGAVFARINEQPQTSVQVRGDESLLFGVVEQILRAAGQAGAKSVRFAAEKKS